jgi:hypothetical protein
LKDDIFLKIPQENCTTYNPSRYHLENTDKAGLLTMKLLTASGGVSSGIAP